MLHEKQSADGKILVAAGGDLRQIYTAAALSAEYAVSVIGFANADLPADITPVRDVQALPAADVLVLPMPVTTDGTALFAPFDSGVIPLAEVLAAIRPGAAVFGGRMPEDVRRQITAAGGVPLDYAADEGFALRNAVPTAEGAILLAMQRLKRTLHGTHCLITGGGRLSTALRTRLRALGAAVTVTARSSADRARAKNDGCAAVPFSAMPEELKTCTLIVNTVPAAVFGADLLRTVRKDALLIDLASKPGGDGAGDTIRKIQNGKGFGA